MDKTNVSQQRALAEKKAKSRWGCIRKGADSRAREGIALLSLALVRPHLERVLSGSGLLSTRNTNISGQSQQRATKVIQGPERLITEETPRELELSSQEGSD